MLSKGYSAALSCALRSSKRLWKDVYPLPTNLWAVTKVVANRGKSGKTISYDYKKGHDNFVIRRALEGWVQSQPRRSLRNWLETDYLSKYSTFRNWYTEIGLRNQADVAPWFNFGRKVPKGYRGYLEDFWRKLVKPEYKPTPINDIRCPNRKASSGLAYTSDGWTYEAEAGEIWDTILEGSEQLFELLGTLAPTWSQLLNPDFRSRVLESLSLDTPVIRTEGGPLKIRWAQNHGKHLYAIERAYIEPLQEVWNTSPFYVGKASHCESFGMLWDDWRGKPLVATHGDDWIAAIGRGRYASGDWSSFDLRITGRQIIMSRMTLAKVLSETGIWEPEWERVFRSLAYIASKSPTIWPWAKVDGQYVRHASVRRKVGSVRSGSGDFVLYNNAMNTAALRTIMEKGFSGWKAFSERAWRQFGWVAKPSAQKVSAEGFVACRTLFLRESGWQPWPCAASVLRNWVRPAFDPLDGWNNLRVVQATRLRELNCTLGYLPDSDWHALITAVGEAALTAGVHDPWGQEYSDEELSRWLQKLSNGYSMSAFLET